MAGGRGIIRLGEGGSEEVDLHVFMDRSTV